MTARQQRDKLILFAAALRWGPWLLAITFVYGLVGLFLMGVGIRAWMQVAG